MDAPEIHPVIPVPPKPKPTTYPIAKRYSLQSKYDEERRKEAEKEKEKRKETLLVGTGGNIKLLQSSGTLSGQV
jgi:hypothetical protein